MKCQIVIATLLHEHGPTGVQAHFNSFKEYLRQQGEAVVSTITPFCASRSLVYPVFGMRRLIDSLNGAVSVWWYRYWHYLFLKQALRKMLKHGKPLIVYAQCPLSAKAAFEARCSVHQRIVMIAHFNLSQACEWADKGKITPKGKMFRSIENTEMEILPKLDGIVYVSRFMQQQLEQRIAGLKGIPAAVIPNFVAATDVSELDFHHADLISIGTLEPRKNQRYLLDVLHHAKQLGHRYTLTLIGDGPDRKMLEQTVRKYGLAQQVTFMGNKAAAARYIKNHRLYVHGALMESFGIVLIEAMAASVPVIAASVGGIPEVFTEGCEGSTWPLDDPEEGARKLIYLMEHPERLQKMAEAARRRYQESFTPGIAASRLANFLCQVGGHAGFAA